MSNRNRANLAIGVALGAAVIASLATVVSLTTSLEVARAQPDDQLASTTTPVVLSDVMLRYNQCLQEATLLYPDDWGAEAARWCGPLARAGIAWVTKAPDGCVTYEVLGRHPETVTLCG